MVVVRSQIEKRLADMYPQIPRKDINRILEIILSEITEALKRDEMLQIRGFGTIKTVKRKTRLARNPRTNQQIKIGNKVGIRFKMAKSLYLQINKDLTKQ